MPMAAPDAGLDADCEALQAAVRMARGFALFFAIGPGGLARERSVSALRSALHGLRIDVLQVSSGQDSLRTYLDTVRQGTPDALIVVGIEVFSDSAERIRFYRRLNAQRNSIARSAPFPVVFMVSPAVVTELRAHAPDFASVTSGYYALPGALPTAASERPSRLDPPLPPEPLYGRANEIEHMVRWLSAQSASGMLLTGCSGSGKSALASWVADHAQRSGDFPDGVYWISLGEKPPIAEIQTALTGSRRLVESNSTRKYVLHDEYRAAMAERRSLLVLDDVTDIADVMALSPGAPQVLILATLCDTNVALSDQWQRVELGPIAEDDAVEVVQTLAGSVTVRDARRLVETCARLPGAIVFACAALRYLDDEDPLVHRISSAADASRVFPLNRAYGAVRALLEAIEARNPTLWHEIKAMSVLRSEGRIPMGALRRVRQRSDTVHLEHVLSRLEADGLVSLSEPAGDRWVALSEGPFNVTDVDRNAHAALLAS
ncbi:MAG: hypothetical protein FJX72_15040 [Armatimonadetes bacterium]|nr:hypothetical protein [Armatimonadota bacterium]